MCFTAVISVVRDSVTPSDALKVYFYADEKFIKFTTCLIAVVLRTLAVVRVNFIHVHDASSINSRTSASELE